MKQKHSTGDEVGDWTLLRYFTKKNRGYWECQCKCGELSCVEVSSLNRGRSRSCRSCAMEKTRDTRLVPAHYWLKLTKHSDKRGHSLLLSHEEAECLLKQQNHKCALTGWQIGFGRGRKKSGRHSDGETTASLDRIDSSLNYTKGNVQWVHKDVNRMKQAFSETRLLEMCEAIIAHAKDGKNVGSTEVSQVRKDAD